MQKTEAFNPQAHEPVGLDAMNNFARLPYFKNGATAHQVSSHDKTGANTDANNCQYTVGSDCVLMDVKEPGSIYNIWMTWGGPLDTPQDAAQVNSRIKFYFDGTLVVNMELKDFFSGSDLNSIRPGGGSSPFLSPLTGNYQVSSGGNYSYLPMPFSQSVKVVVSPTPANILYYHINYDTFSRNTGVNTFTGNETVTDIQDMMNNAMNDPKSTTGNSITSGNISIDPNSTVALPKITGRGSINSIKFKSSTGQDQALNNAQLKIYWDDEASPSVDAPFADFFGDGLKKDAPSWKNTTIENAGSSEGDTITVTANGETRFFEFYTLDPGLPTNHHWVQRDPADPIAELANFWGTIYNLTFGGFYLNSIDWNGDGNALVISPNNDVADAIITTSHPENFNITKNTWPRTTVVHSLPIGVDNSGWYYSYFPMPYNKSAQIEIVDEGEAGITGLDYEIQNNTVPYVGLGNSAGYFKAKYNSGTPTTNGQDYSILDLDNNTKGSYVGTVLNIRNAPDDFWEGDERIYVDGSLTPQIYGTGTEDYFNAGWVFYDPITSGQFNTFSLPTHGLSGYSINSDSSHNMSAYRMYLSDAIPFNKSIKVGIEHGGANNINADYSSVAFYYALPSSGLSAPDTLDLSDPSSRNSHGYAPSGSSGTTLQSYYEGDNDNVLVPSSGTDSGYAFGDGISGGSSQFTMSIDENNTGVKLRRTMDYAMAKQSATVTVCNITDMDCTSPFWTGTWYDGGVNSSKKWRDSDLEIPGSITTGIDSIRIKIANDNVGLASWNEYQYQAFSYLDIDPNAPTTTSAISPITPNGSNSWYKGTAPTVTLSATDAGSDVADTYYSWTGDSNFTTYSGVLTVPAGANTLWYYSVDNAGNEEAHQSVLYKYDSTPPQVYANVGGSEIVNASFSCTTWANDPDDPVGSGSGIASYLWQQMPYPGSLGTVTFSDANIKTPTISASSDGTYAVRLTVTDNAGNSAHSDTTFIWDITGPSISLSQAYDGMTTTLSSITVSGTASDSRGVSSTTVNGTNQSNPASFSQSIKLKNGSNAIAVVSTDSLGNSSSNILHVTKTTGKKLGTTANPADVIASSTITLDSINDGSGDSALFSAGNTPTIYTQRPTFKGTTVANSTVTLTIDGSGGITGRTTSDNNGNWSYTLDKNLSFGSHTINLEAETSSGEKLTSSTYNFTTAKALAGNKASLPTPAEIAEGMTVQTKVLIGVLAMLALFFFMIINRQRHARI